MPDAEQFRYEGLFAKTTPGTRERSAVRQAKYDFAVANPNPASLPLDELMEALDGALRDEGPVAPTGS